MSGWHRQLFVLTAIMTFWATTQPAIAQSPTSDTITVTDAWTRITPPGAKVAVGFLTITNKGEKPITLKDASVAIAEQVEIHSMVMSNGMMKMRHLADGLEIKPGETLTLKPSGIHLMFMQLTEPPKLGTTISGKLVFDDLGELDVSYAVEPLGARSNKKEHAH